MNFIDWKTLFESLTNDVLAKEAEKVKNLIADKFNKLYSVPNFETFKRPGEPEQQSNLFTDDELNTFSINYTSKGAVYSVDIWKKTSIQPFVTYYVEKGSIDNVAAMIPTIVKDPSKASISKKRVLQENVNDELHLIPKDPKPEIYLDPIVKNAEKSDDEYDYADPDTIFEDLHRYVGMIISGTQPSLLITGPPGVGKTYPVIEQLNSAGLKKDVDYIHIKGRSTAAGLFISLYENNGKIIVFDDCDSIFSREDAVNILKGALDSYEDREISWLVGKPLKDTAGKKVPKSFPFTGHVIFISNLPQRKINSAIKTRSFILEVALTPKDMLAKMKKDLPNVYPEVSLSLREEALEFVEKVSLTAKNLELNMRTLVKAIKILQEIDNLEVAKRLIMQQCSYK